MIDALRSLGGVGFQQALPHAVYEADDAGASGVPDLVRLLVRPQVAVAAVGVVQADDRLLDDLAVQAQRHLIDLGRRQVQLFGKGLRACSA